jgi:hypothetical protein
MEPERRGQCRQRLVIAGFISSACRAWEITRPRLPGAWAAPRGHYDLRAFNGSTGSRWTCASVPFFQPKSLRHVTVAPRHLFQNRFFTGTGPYPGIPLHFLFWRNRHNQHGQALPAFLFPLHMGEDAGACHLPPSRFNIGSR